jgi:hypothetical protein
MKKIGLLSLALVLALGALGIGYATWSDNVTIEQTIYTGNFEIGIRDVGTNDPCESNDPSYDKHVASCNSSNHDYVGSLQDTDYYAKIVEVLDNVYPCYSCNITWEIANLGSVPAFLGTWDTNVSSGNSDLWDCVELKSWEITAPDGSVYPGVSWEGLFLKMQEIQVDEGQTYQVVIEKHILQDCVDESGREFECPQDASVTVEHELMFVQWNKIGEFVDED